MRILITGSRDWDDAGAIHTALDAIAREAFRIGEEITVVHGCARGADMIADGWARDRRQNWPVLVERHPADWKMYGRRAGWVRNHRMVQAGADICLAFINNESAGATGCANLAERAGIRTERFIVGTVEPMPDQVP
jgi:hypothetical protein